MLNFFKSGYYFFFKWILILVLISIFIGLSIWCFLNSLTWVSTYRDNNLNLIFYLPFAGLLIGYLFYFYGKAIIGGNNLIIDSFFNSQIKISFLITPLIFIATLFTHLFGGSAGREGAGIQISSGFIDTLVKRFNCTQKERKILLKVAVAGGFSAVFGTPFAGIFFAFEFFNIGKPYFKGFFSIMFVAFFATFITRFLGAEHIHLAIHKLPQFEAKFLIYLIICGLLFGSCAYIFSKCLHFFTFFFQGICNFLPLRLFIGGIFILLLFLFVKTDIYLGLGLPTIQKAFVEPQKFEVFLLKMIFTLLTLGSGFKGGEVTPLFFIGSTFGSFLSLYIPLPLDVLAAVGFVSVFAAAANTPIACLIMAIEVFGWRIFPFACITCFIAYYTSGYSSIFKQQKITNFKTFPIKKYLGKRISQL